MDVNNFFFKGHFLRCVNHILFYFIFSTVNYTYIYINFGKICQIFENKKLTKRP
jgi:hypothetical protein